MLESGDRREGKLGGLAKLVAASATMGGLAALLVLPGVGAAGLGAKKAADDFRNMNIEKITRSPSEKTIVYAADGRPIVTFFNEFREPVRLDQVSMTMRKAIVAIEDARFYEHGPLDVKGTLRALTRNASSGATVEGGSTLTQQYAKNLLLANARTKADRQRVTASTVLRKVRELRYAISLEQALQKNQVLEGYLNIAYFGAGAYGVQAAAQRFFSKPASLLTLPEAALLAGLTKNPVAFDPTRHPKAAKLRRDTVLRRMAELGLVPQATAAKLIAKKIKLRPRLPRGGCSTSRVPFYCTYIRNEMIKILSRGDKDRVKDAIDRIQSGGFTVRTSFDWNAQAAAQRALDARTSSSSNKVAAEALIEIGTGQIKALVSSKRFGMRKPKTTINLAADAAHGGGVGVSAGSTFKIFTLMTALEKGYPVGTSYVSPGAIRIGGFKTCKGKRLPLWTVKNSHESVAGVFNLRTGTLQSVNTFYAKLQRSVGLCSAVRMAERFGMRRADGRPLQQVAPQVLGSNEVDMVHLSAAFAGIANHGRYCAPTAITEITRPNGKMVRLPANQCRQVVGPHVADTAMNIMRGIFGHEGTANKVSPPGAGAGGKTGTCESFSCAVFAGAYGRLASAVAYWDYRGGFRHPVWGVYGAGLPAKVWSSSLRSANAARRPLVPLPATKGMALGAAMTVLNRGGFRTVVSNGPVNSALPMGSVAYTSPSTRLEKGGTVMVYLSNGPTG
ncbi:transglycosylase domain-containing protein [Actinocorallia longicatena]|uniref:Transglycosylase domain-containing protein n=1 Tax=Actinocorallia longicatena TaxID=111803 RepID=A0ABP6Q9P0_9ACTN